MKKINQDNVIEIDLQELCAFYHTKQNGYFTPEEMSTLYFAGHFTDEIIFDTDELDYQDYGYEFNDCCGKWKEE